MQTITITGGQTLCGTIRPAAAKNSVLPLLAATLLCGAPCCLRGAPRLTDVDTSLALLTAVGAKAVRHGPDLCTLPAAAGTLRRDSRPSGGSDAQFGVLSGTAALPHRHGSAPAARRLPSRPRPVDIHLAGLAAMGAKVELEGKLSRCAGSGRCRGGLYPTAAQCGCYHDADDGRTLRHGHYRAAGSRL